MDSSGDYPDDGDSRWSSAKESEGDRSSDEDDIFSGDDDREEKPRAWRGGEVIGCLLEVSEDRLATMSFALNGRPLGPAFESVAVDAAGLYPACSLRSGDRVLLNFGGSAFQFLPAGFRGVADPLDWMRGLHDREGQGGPARPEEPVGEERYALDAAIAAHYNDQWTKLVGMPASAAGPADAVLTATERFRKSTAVDVVAEETREDPLLARCSPEVLQRRFSVLCRLNVLIKTLLPVLNIDSICPGGPASPDIRIAGTRTRLLALFAAVKELIFVWNKEDLVQAMILDCTTEGYAKPVVLNRIKPSRHSILADPNGPATPHATARPAAPPEDANTLFHQLHERFYHCKPHLFRQHESCDSSGRLWTVVFEGEAAEDAGGPFRESLAQVCEELMSDATPLFIPSPNQRNNVGETREMSVPNPSARDPEQLQQYRFLGRLMAGCITINEPLNLNLPSLVWKILVGHPTDKGDLGAVDQMCAKCMDNLCSLDEAALPPEALEELIAETFRTVLSDGTEVELLPGGRERAVTFEQRHEYARLVVEARLNESREQILAMRQGLLDVLPPYLLALLTWRDLELRVCGVPEIDIQELQKTAIYEDLPPSHPTCVYFWEALRGFGQRELKLLLRFIAGRSRLPLQIKLQEMPTQGNPDHYLPQAHTCFFSIELPAYSSVDAMRGKLLYAIHNCRAIDTDGDPDNMDDHDDDEDDDMYDDDGM